MLTEIGAETELFKVVDYCKNSVNEDFNNWVILLKFDGGLRLFSKTDRFKRIYDIEEWISKYRNATSTKQIVKNGRIIYPNSI